MIVTGSEIATICDDIWRAILGIELELVGDVAHPPGTRTLTACVQITGDWNGAVTVVIDEDFARLSAATMFGLTPEEIASEETDDTVGELANMVGGNVKALVPGSCQLSLPSVTRGVDYEVSVPGSRQLDRVAFRHGDGLVVVTTLRASPEAGDLAADG